MSIAVKPGQDAITLTGGGTYDTTAIDGATVKRIVACEIINASTSANASFRWGTSGKAVVIPYNSTGTATFKVEIPFGYALSITPTEKLQVVGTTGQTVYVTWLEEC